MHSLHVPTYPSLTSSRVIANHVTRKLANRETAAILDESNSPISLETRNLLFARVFLSQPFWAPRRHSGSRGRRIYQFSWSYVVTSRYQRLHVRQIRANPHTDKWTATFYKLIPSGASRKYTTISIIFKLYSPRYPVNITFSRRGRSAKSYFSCVVYHVLARYSILFGVHDSKLY